MSSVLFNARFKVNVCFVVNSRFNVRGKRAVLKTFFIKQSENSLQKTVSNCFLLLLLRYAVLLLEFGPHRAGKFARLQGAHPALSAASPQARLLSAGGDGGDDGGGVGRWWWWCGL